MWEVLETNLDKFDSYIETAIETTTKKMLINLVSKFTNNLNTK